MSALRDAILTDCSESLKICKTPSFSRVAPPGHSNGHVSVGTNGHPAETLSPTDSVRWARPQPKMAFAPLMVGQHLRLVLNPLRPTDREPDTPPDAGTARSEQSNCHFVLCLITHEIDQKLAGFTGNLRKRHFLPFFRLCAAASSPALLCCSERGALQIGGDSAAAIRLPAALWVAAR